MNPACPGLVRPSIVRPDPVRLFSNGLFAEWFTLGWFTLGWLTPGWLVPGWLGGARRAGTEPAAEDNPLPFQRLQAGQRRRFGEGQVSGNLGGGHRSTHFQQPADHRHAGLRGFALEGDSRGNPHVGPGGPCGKRPPHHRQPFGGHPAHPAPRALVPRRPPRPHQLVKQGQPVARQPARAQFTCRGNHHPAQQQVVQFIGRANLRLRLGPHPLNRQRIEPAEVRDTLHRQRAAGGDSARPAFSDLAPIEEGVRVGVQQFVTEWAGLARVAGNQLNLTPVDLAQDLAQPLEVVRLLQAVVHRLPNERMVGQHMVARDVFLAPRQLREDGGQQVVGPKPLQRRGNLPPIAEPRHQQGAGHVPAPAGGERRHIQQRLLEQLVDIPGVEHAEHALERKAVLRPEREDQPVIVGGRLEFKIETPTEPLPHRQPPRLGNPGPKRGMDDQLHPPRFVEEPLEHNPLVRGEQPDRRLLGTGIQHHLIGGDSPHSSLALQPLRGRLGLVDAPLQLFPQAGDLLRQLERSPRGLAAPEGNAGRSPPGVDHGDVVPPDVHNPPRGVPQEKDLARRALAGEVFVEGPDDGLVGLGDHAVRGDLGNRAAVRRRCEPGSLPAPHPSSHPVPMQKHPPPPASRRHPFREVLQGVVKVAAGQPAIGPRPPTEGEQLLGRPLLAAHLGDHLLRQDVERSGGNGNDIQPPRADRPNEREAFDQFVAGQRDQATLGHQPQRMPRPPHPLQERGDRTGRTNLDHQVDVANVEAQLERGGRHHRLELAVLQPLFGVVPQVGGQRPVMTPHRLFSQQLRELVGDPLGHPPGVHKDQRAAV